MGLTWEEVFIYLDDLIVFTPTFEIFVERLERLFQELVSANSQLKPSQCYFGFDSKCLGHMISNQGISWGLLGIIACSSTSLAKLQDNWWC